MKSDYKVARGLCDLIEGVGWFLIIISIGCSVIAFFQGGAFGLSILYGIMVWLGFLIIGLFIIMGAQVTRATVDNADYTRLILDEINKLKPE